MEKIFNDSRVSVNDGGFSDMVIKHILEGVPVPSRAIYRGPTLVAAFAAAMVIFILTFTVGLGEMNDRYDRLANSISSHNTTILDTENDTYIE